MPLEEEIAAKILDLVSRSVHEPIWDPVVIGQAVADLPQRAPRRLRQEGKVTGSISVFAPTSPHRPRPTYNVGAHGWLAAPTKSAGPLVTAARVALVPKLLHGMAYMRTGIPCLDTTTKHALNSGEPQLEYGSTSGCYLFLGAMACLADG